MKWRAESALCGNSHEHYRTSVCARMSERETEIRDIASQIPLSKNAGKGINNYTAFFLCQTFSCRGFSPLLCVCACMCRVRGSRLYRSNQRRFGPWARPHSCQKHSATWSCCQRWTPAVWRPHTGGKGPPIFAAA